MLKPIIIAAAVVFGTLGLSASAYAAEAKLVKCDFKFNPEAKANMYLGTYRALPNKMFMRWFPMRCPMSIEV